MKSLLYYVLIVLLASSWAWAEPPACKDIAARMPDFSVKPVWFDGAITDFKNGVAIECKGRGCASGSGSTWCCECIENGQTKHIMFFRGKDDKTVTKGWGCPECAKPK